MTVHQLTPVRKITARDCEDAGMPDMPTVGELVIAAALAGNRGDLRRRRLYLDCAMRKLLRAQREARAA